MPLLTSTAGPVDFRYETVAPASSAVRGSIAIRIDNGNEGIFQNTDGATTWRQVMAAGGTVAFTGDATWTLNDASATALSIGAAGATGMLVFDTTNGSERLAFGVGTLDVSGQATVVLLRDNTNSALAFRTASGQTYLNFRTSDGNEIIDLGTTPSSDAGTPVQDVRVLSPGAIELNGIDFGTRLVVDEPFHLRPDLAANVANADANKNICVIGTNSAAWTFATGGGVTGTTPANLNDQQCLRGQTAANQGIWSNTNWSTNDEVRYKCNLRTGAAITTQVLAAGLKLSLTAGATLFDNTTDADQVFFGYATDNRYTASAANWVAVIRIGGASANVDTTVVVGTGTNYRFVIDISSTRVARFYINGVLRATSAAITAGVNLLPFAGTETLAGAARAVTVQRLCCSKLLT